MKKDMDKAELLGLKIINRAPKKKKQVNKMWDAMTKELFAGDYDAPKKLAEKYQEMLNNL